MAPAHRTDPIVAPLCFLILSTLILTISLHISMYPTHDEEIQLGIQTKQFNYSVSTYHNRRGNRCALFRCGDSLRVRTNVHTSCDKVYLRVIQSKTNRSSRLCIVDYISQHWDALSRTYNEGIAYVADDVQLKVDTINLPLEGKHVHFSFARNGMDIGASWFSVFPSNTSRKVFQDWADLAMKEKNVKSMIQPEQIFLNRVRSCKAIDIMCHARYTLIAYQCDGISRAPICMREEHIRDAMRMMAIVITTVVCIRIVVAASGQIARRRRGWTKARIWQLMMIPGQTRTGFATIALGFLAFGLLAALPWTAIVETVGRGLGTKVVHRFESDHLWGDIDVYKSVTDLRGRNEGHSYILKDGHESVRVSGAGTDIVIWFTTIALFLRDVIHGGIVLKCLLCVVITKALSGMLVNIIGMRKEEAVKEDEYYDGKSELVMKVMGKGKGRSFLISRDRVNVIGKTG